MRLPSGDHEGFSSELVMIGESSLIAPIGVHHVDVSPWFPSLTETKTIRLPSGDHEGF